MNISEFELIRKIKDEISMSRSDVICGIGDDCAVVKKDDTHAFLLSTDCLVESVHFDFKYFSFIDLGKKALNVGLSDIAAMGGEPLYAFVTLGIPAKTSEQDVLSFYTGLDHAARAHGVIIAGGDVSRSRDSFFVSLTVVGQIPYDQVKPRSTAKPGDHVYVSGTLGTSALGLVLLRKGRRGENIYIQAHKNPIPRIKLGRVLAGIPEVHAMIDVSDGLVQDLGHVALASGVAAKIEFRNVPRQKDFEVLCREFKADPVKILLAGGEDYELLFTMSEAGSSRLAEALEQMRGIGVTRIGEIVSAGSEGRSDVTVQDEEGGLVNIGQGGFDHFFGP